MALACALLAGACGPEEGAPAPRGPFELLDEGAGPTLMEHVPVPDGAWFSYYVSTQSTLQSVSYEGTLVHAGVELQREVTALEVAYIGYGDDATLFFGTDTAGILDEGVVTGSHPIRAGRRWTAGVASFPDLFEFHVVGQETIETPAGTFDAVRIDQLNRSSNTDVARWFAPGVGLVHRVGADGVGGPLARTTLVELALPEAP